MTFFLFQWKKSTIVAGLDNPDNADIMKNVKRVVT